MKKILLTIIIILAFVQLNAQHYILLKFKTQEDIPSFSFSKETKSYTIKTNDFQLQSLLLKHKIKIFNKEFPSAHLVPHKNAKILDLYYRIVTYEKIDSLYNNLIKEKIKILEDEIFLGQETKILSTPNDYDINNVHAGGASGNMSSKPQNDLINANGAWNITTGNPNIRTAVLDINFSRIHEEMQGKVVVDSAFAMGTLQSNYSNSWHGTGVASLVAGNTNNNKGIASIGYNTKLDLYDAPGIWNSDFTIYYSTYDQLIRAALNGARVINCSFYGGCGCTAEQLLIDMIFDTYKTVIVVAAGNFSSYQYNESGQGATDNSLASYNHVITTTSIGYLKNTSEFDINNLNSNFKDVHQFYGWYNQNSFTHSHYGKVDLAAPGYDVVMPYSPSITHNTTYGRAGGTSFATPIVSGTAALMLSVNPSLNPDDVRAILKKTSRDIYEEPLNYPFINGLGAGRLDAGKAVELAQTWVPGTGYVESSKPTGIQQKYIWKSGTQTVIVNTPPLSNDGTPWCLAGINYEAIGSSNNDNYKWLIFRIRNPNPNSIHLTPTLPPDIPIIKYGRTLNLLFGIDLPYEQDIYSAYSFCVRDNNNVPSKYYKNVSNIPLSFQSCNYVCPSDINFQPLTTSGVLITNVESSTWIKINSGNYDLGNNQHSIKLDSHPLDGYIEFVPNNASYSFKYAPNSAYPNISLIAEPFNGCTQGVPQKINQTLDQNLLPKEKVEIKLNPQIQPNPSNGIFNLMGISKNSIIEVFDIMGKQIIKMSAQESKLVIIDLSRKPSGIYFVKINNTLTKKIVKF